jgi:hypothetical protein
MNEIWMKVDEYWCKLYDNHTIWGNMKLTSIEKLSSYPTIKFVLVEPTLH